MRKSKTKKNTEKLSKIKKTKKKLLNPFSLQPLTDAYQNFKKKQKKEIANKIKREKIEQQKQLLQEKKQKIIAHPTPCRCNNDQSHCFRVV